MSTMARVNKTNRCVVCGKDTWCLYGKDMVVCMRVQSDRAKTFKGGEVGYFHQRDPNAPAPKYVKPKREYKINATNLLSEWSHNSRMSDIPRFAALLGVSEKSLYDIRCVPAPWDNAWGFAMKDGYGNNIGIRVRNEQGRKWAVTGSHAGIFYPSYPPPKRIIIVEGPTDSAAAITLGFFPVGRPSCSGGSEHIMAFIRKHRVQEVVIVADNDDPGIRGANDLLRLLPVAACILILPVKDLREFSSIGDKSTIDAMIDQLVWTRQREVA